MVKNSILIVDDEPDILTVHSFQVKKIIPDVKILKCSNGDEAITAFKGAKVGEIGLTLLDFRMPGLNGFETVKEIRKIDPEAQIIVVTANINDCEEKRKIIKNLDGPPVVILGKPVNFLMLAELIKGVWG